MSSSTARRYHPTNKLVQFWPFLLFELGIATMFIYGTPAWAEDDSKMMPSQAASEVAELFASSLQDNGFIRSGLNFYRYGNESVLLIDVQPGTLWFGPSVNLGVYYYKFGEMDRPKLVDCHVQTRLVSVVSNPLREEELLQLTNDIPPETRRAELLDMLVTSALPWLSGMAALDSARTFLNGSTKAAHVAPIARGDFARSSD